MEENEIVKRVRDSKDRRIVRIHVLDEGKSIIKEVIKKRQEYLGEVLEGFSIEEVAVLNEYLLLLHTQMKIVDDKEVINKERQESERAIGVIVWGVGGCRVAHEVVGQL